jgi:hypothetical protein
LSITKYKAALAPGFGFQRRRGHARDCPNHGLSAMRKARRKARIKFRRAHPGFWTVVNPVEWQIPIHEGKCRMTKNRACQPLVIGILSLDV